MELHVVAPGSYGAQDLCRLLVQADQSLLLQLLCSYEADLGFISEDALHVSQNHASISSVANNDTGPRYAGLAHVPLIVTVDFKSLLGCPGELDCFFRLHEVSQVIF